jgi:hypothetical protein
MATRKKTNSNKKKTIKKTPIIGGCINNKNHPLNLIVKINFKGNNRIDHTCYKCLKTNGSVEEQWNQSKKTHKILRIDKASTLDINRRFTKGVMWDMVRHTKTRYLLVNKNKSKTRKSNK